MLLFLFSRKEGTDVFATPSVPARRAVNRVGDEGGGFVVADSDKGRRGTGDPRLLGGQGSCTVRRGLSPRVVGDEHRGVLVLGGKVGHTFKVVAWHDQMPTRRCGHRQ